MSTTRTVAQIETATTEFVCANKVKRAGFLILCVALCDLCETLCN